MKKLIKKFLFWFVLMGVIVNIEIKKFSSILRNKHIIFDKIDE